MKKCRTCNRIKDNSEYNVIKSTYEAKDGPISYSHLRKDCKECHTKKKYEKMLQSKFGLSLTDYKALLEKQNNRCASCKRDFSGREPFIDHDHITGHHRGLLCAKCNFGIGHFDDDIDLMLQAIEYLKAWLQVVPEGDSCN